MQMTSVYRWTHRHSQLAWFEGRQMPSAFIWVNSRNGYDHTHNRFMAFFPALPGSASARRNLLLDFMVQGKITEADTHQAGRHSIWTNQRPTSIIPQFLHQMPFLSQPSHFILACIHSGVVAYPVVWL